jgi:multidrug efflux pump subunit AcrA (membrane-fusion protein)
MMGLADDEGHPLAGVVNFLDNKLDPGTGTLQVRGVFRNPDRMLRPGLFVRVRLPVGDAYRALLVSEEALGTDQGQKFVYVVDQSNKAEYRRVEVGKLQDGRRVVLKGLSEGERVVVSGLQRVRPGELVRPRMINAANRDRTSPREPSAVAEAPPAPATISPGEARPANGSPQVRESPRKQAATGASLPVAR